jgi:2Fe-2S iron-sulfur cluster binding domain
MKDGAAQSVSRDLAKAAPKTLLLTFLNHSHLRDGVRDISEICRLSGSRELIGLSVNGERVHVDAPDDIPLLWVLRDTPNLTGTEFGCGIAQCGACTVQVNDQARRLWVVRPTELTGARALPPGRDPRRHSARLDRSAVGTHLAAPCRK